MLEQKLPNTTEGADKLVNNNDESFPSSKLLLSVIQKEYDYEANRLKNLENRTGMFLAFTSAILIFLTNKLSITNIYGVKVNSVFQALPYTILIFTTIIALIILLMAAYCFIRVISLGEYGKIDLKNFSEEILLSTARVSEEKVAMGLIDLYKDILEHNISTNNLKNKYFARGSNFILIALIVIVITYVISSFIVNI